MRYGLFLFFCGLFQLLSAQSPVDSLLDASQRLYENGAYEATVRTSEMGLAHLKKQATPDSLLCSQLWYYGGMAQYYLDDYPASVAAYNQALIWTPTNPKGQNLRGMLFYERAYSEEELGQLQKAYRSVQKAEEVLSQLVDPDYDYLLSIYGDLSGRAAEQGDFALGENYLRKGRRLYQDHAAAIELAQGAASKAVLFAYKSLYLYWRKGVKSKTDLLPIEREVKGLDQLRQQKKFNAQEQLMYAVSLNLAGDVLLNIDTTWRAPYLAQAQKYLEAALKALDGSGYPSYYEQFRFNQSKVLLYRGQPQKALAILNAIFEQTSSTSNLAFYHAQRARVYLSLHDQTKALADYEKMRSYLHRGDEPLADDGSNFKPGDVLSEAGLLLEMAAIGQAALSQEDAYWLSYYQNGLQQLRHCYWGNQFNPKIREYYEKGVAGVLQNITNSSSPNRWSWSQLLEYMENLENRLLWQEFRHNRQARGLSRSDSLEAVEANLRRQLVEAIQGKEELLIFELEKKIAQHQAQVNAANPLRAQTLGHEFRLAELQQKMAEGELLLRYINCDGQYYCFQINSEQIELHSLGAADRLDHKINAYLHQLQNREPAEELAQELYHQLLRPNQWLNSAQSLAIIPAGQLHYLPFETLKEEKQYTIEKWPISYAPHLAFVHPTTARETRDEEIACMIFTPSYPESEHTIATRVKDNTRDEGQQLLGAMQESQRIAALFNSVSYRGSEASVDNFMRQAPRAQMLHLAMHATVDAEHPGLSHLWFSPDEKGTEKLYLEELYGLELGADLAVLSACNTGRSSRDRRQGMASLHRAFIQAGVPTTVASLWAVPDQATGKIMVDFYQQLCQAKSKAEALRQAKLTYLQQTRDSNFRKPYYWAGFIVYGDAAPLSLSAKPNLFHRLSLRQWGTGLLVLGIPLLFFLFYHHRK